MGSFVVSRKNSGSEVRAALQLWQAFEYLSPQTPPKPECMPDRCIWRVQSSSIGEGEMPWVDPKKREDLYRFFNHPKRFLLYAGLISGAELVDFVRVTLGASALDFSEQSSPGDAASVVLPIDSDGYVAGPPFVSTVPWALGGLQEIAQRRGLFDFSGFFGQDGIQERAVQEMQELLVKLQLISKPSEVGVPSQPLKLEEKKKQFRTVTAEDVNKVVALAFELLGWKPKEQLQWIVQTQRIPAKGAKRLEDPLNSFYAEEIENVQRQFIKKNFGAALGSFLESNEHPSRVDLDEDRSSLVAGLHPSLIPPAAWPSKYPLVTAQQFAVNAIRRDLAETGGIFSVNGPPGTGKTTMLKDILANVIQTRAEVLCMLESPDDAFAGRLEIENYAYPAWRLIDSLRGFGVVATSANNGAVENISKELPGIGAIDEGLALDYFSEVADTLVLDPGRSRQPTPSSWGLVSAALGNSSNRSTFANAFWFADMRPADGTSNEEPDPLRAISLQAWINQNSDLTPKWADAREQYIRSSKLVQQLLASAAKLADEASEYSALLGQRQELSQEVLTREEQIGRLTKKATLAARNLESAKNKLEATTADHAQLVDYFALREARDSMSANLLNHEVSRPGQTSVNLSKAFKEAKLVEAADRNALDKHVLARPGIIWLILHRSAVRAWEDRKRVLETRVDLNRKHIQESQVAILAATAWEKRRSELTVGAQSSNQKFEDAKRAVEACSLSPDMTTQQAEYFLNDAKLLHGNALADHQSAIREHQLEASAIALCRAKLRELDIKAEALENVLRKEGLLDVTRPAWQLMGHSRDELHKTSPYQDDDVLFAARRQLFIASMNLHKAFLMNAWKRMKPTLSAFVSVLQGQLPARNVKGGVMALWDAFFLAVPLVSTTFASFPRLFKGVECEDLAWVLIDEAGQAAPQQAVGALWRARRAIVVGDPIQLEPVVGIPAELVDPLSRFCGTSATYVPPQASVQTLADQSNRYGTYLGGSDPETRIWVGSPLVVHRRCLNPMFEIANAIAYENKMVYGTLGEQGVGSTPSEWIDVPNTGAMGHWVPAQGAAAMEIIIGLTGRKVRDDDGKLRVYVVTPFKVVAENMRSLIAKSLGQRDAGEMCGTVHTFQGKEADHVIFLLGGDPRKPGVISSFAGRKPNLVNVAVTRAKKRLYVIGQRSYWCGNADVNRFYTLMEQKLSIPLPA